jgi:hypothetical protein
MDYFFEQEQRLRFKIADADSGSKDLIGDYYCSLGDIMGGENQTR